MVFKGLIIQELSARQADRIKATLAGKIASACSVDIHSVSDLYGVFTTVSLAADGEVSALVKDIDGVTASELAARFYSTSFREDVIKAVRDILGSETFFDRIAIAAVSLKPMPFSPLVLTSTRTTTSSTATVTSTITMTVTATQTPTQTPHSGVMLLPGAQHKDYSTTAQRSAAVLQVAALPWGLVVILGILAVAERFLS